MQGLLITIVIVFAIMFHLHPKEMATLTIIGSIVTLAVWRMYAVRQRRAAAAQPGGQPQPQGGAMNRALAGVGGVGALLAVILGFVAFAPIIQGFLYWMGAEWLAKVIGVIPVTVAMLAAIGLAPLLIFKWGRRNWRRFMAVGAASIAYTIFLSLLPQGESVPEGWRWLFGIVGLALALLYAAALSEFGTSKAAYAARMGLMMGSLATAIGLALWLGIVSHSNCAFDDSNNVVEGTECTATQELLSSVGIRAGNEVRSKARDIRDADPEKVDSDELRAETTRGGIVHESWVKYPWEPWIVRPDGYTTVCLEDCPFHSRSLTPRACWGESYEIAFHLEPRDGSRAVVTAIDHMRHSHDPCLEWLEKAVVEAKWRLPMVDQGSGPLYPAPEAWVIKPFPL